MRKTDAVRVTSTIQYNNDDDDSNNSKNNNNGKCEKTNKIMIHMPWQNLNAT